METILFKLSRQDIQILYLINNKIVGLELALKDNRIKNNPFLYNELERLKVEIYKLPCPCHNEDINMVDQLTANDIGEEAIKLINTYL